MRDFTGEFRGLPEFTQHGVGWSRREWAARVGEIKSFSWIATSHLAPAMSRTINLYTVPTARIFYLSEVNAGAGGMLGEDSFRGFFRYQDNTGTHFWDGYIEPFYATGFHSLLTPPSLTAGRILQFYSRNEDIMIGREAGFYSGWETPASVPLKPLNNNPDELFFKGDFNSCHTIFLSCTDQIFLFHKRSDDDENYLRITNYGNDNQRIVFQRKISFTQAKELKEVTERNPDGLGALIKTIEK